MDDFDGFRTTPPDPNLKPDYSERFHLAGYNRIQQEEAYKFYQQWTAPDFPRVLIVKIQHANPYYDDSYAVNSANVGPYGDAIENELIPAIEKQFRGLGTGWSRFVYGGSTGGWESLAVQVFYPDHYNGAFAACPDPVDFHGYMTINLYDDKNAFFIEGAHKRVPQPAMRDYLGHTLITTQENSHTNLRSAITDAAESSLTSGRQSMVRLATTDIRSRFSTSRPATSTIAWPTTGGSITILKRSWSATGQRWVRSLRARSTSMSDQTTRTS